MADGCDDRGNEVTAERSFEPLAEARVRPLESMDPLRVVGCRRRTPTTQAGVTSLGATALAVVKQLPLSW